MAANTIGYDVVARSISDAATDVGALVVKQALEISERYLPPRAKSGSGYDHQRYPACKTQNDLFGRGYI
jgi:hypothetical protein